MEKCDDSGPIEPGMPEWRPGTFAFWHYRHVDPNDARSTSVLLRHPVSPFVRYPKDLDGDTLRGCAYEYLVQANERVGLKLPARWLGALDPARDPEKPDPAFAWLPIERRLEQAEKRVRDDADPMVSFWFDRYLDSKMLDRTLVLLASQRIGKTFIRSEFGLRVLAHVRSKGGQHEVRINGVSASIPFGPYRSPGVETEDWPSVDKRGFVDLLLEAREDLGTMLGLRDGSVKFRGLRVGRAKPQSWRFELHGTGVAKTETFSYAKRSEGRSATVQGREDEKARPYSYLDTRHYAFQVVGEASPEGDLLSLSRVRKTPFVANAAGQGCVFPRDPASMGNPTGIRKRRPTRSEEELDQCRVDQLVATMSPAPLELAGLLEVMECPRFVREDSDPNSVKSVNLPGGGPPIRSNDFAAISAFVNFGDLFARFTRYGIDPEAYFRIARLPLKVLYRSGVRPGPGEDGQTVNARVLPEFWKVDFVGPTPPDDRPRLEVHLALANLSHRARRPWDGVNRSPAEPLGIAADARWMWHEIGHILLMAAVGELEFRFAHSPGDAFAAIVADPKSGLATDPRWRGATFPWVFIPRRHDRCVMHGWSWCGTMHQPLSLLPDSDRLRRKGYWSEQILSSSLFRLYRCLGGDTTQIGSTSDESAPDRIARESASHYSVYLIIKAIGLLGSSGAVPANHADQYVSALIDADIGTQQWSITVPGDAAPIPIERVGGCAHKVIRWAFEAQGMYAEPGEITNAPGLPPPVDVYIEDRRGNIEKLPSLDVTHRPGGYVPVSLDWPGDAAMKGGWHAHEDAIKQDNGGGIVVTVKNRGDSIAQGVTVQVWRKAWSANATDHDWDQGGGWVLCNPLDGATTTAVVPAQSSGVTFGPYVEPATAGSYLILAQATCADDRANTDVSTGLPCSQLPTPLVDVVANDNNLGLCVITIT